MSVTRVAVGSGGRTLGPRPRARLTAPLSAGPGRIWGQNTRERACVRRLWEPQGTTGSGAFPPRGAGAAGKRPPGAQCAGIVSLVAAPLQTKASLSPSLRHPVLTATSVTHMAPGGGPRRPTALSGEHLLTLPARCLPTSASPLPGFLLNQPISSGRR